MADVGIKAQLELEDLASAVLKEIQGQLGNTQEETEATQKSFKTWLSESAQLMHNLGIDLTGVARDVAAFGKSFVDAAAGGQADDYAIAGLVTMVQGADFAKAIDQAGELGDVIDDIAVGSGAVGNVGDAFQRLVEMTGASEQGIGRAKGQIAQLSEISRVLGKDVGAITQEFGMMQEGVLRTRGQLFQLLQPTGAFGKDAKKAAEAWGKLTEEKRAEVLNSAIGQVADRFKEFPPSFANLTSSLSHLGDVTKEKLGEPFMEELTPAIKELLGELEDMSPELTSLARELGKDFGGWVRTLGKDIRGAFEWIKSNKEEIGNAIKESFAFARSVVEFILSHKEELAVAFGAKTAMGIAQGVAGAAGSVAEVGKTINPNAGALGATIGVAALTAAIVGLGLAADQAAKLIEDLDRAEEDRVDATLADQRAMAKAISEGNVDKLERMRKTQAGMASERGEVFVGSEKDMELQQAIKSAQIVQEMNANKIVDNAKVIDLASRQVADAYGHASSEFGSATSAHADAVAVAATSKIIAAYNFATVTGDAAAAAHAARLIEGSTHLQDAFMQSGLIIEGGIQNFATKLLDQSGKLAQALGGLAGNKMPGKTPKVNFNLTGSGSVNINVKQDFRNQDPDRVAFMFQRDLQRAAERRFMASTSTPFGT